jgi:hypothetical protein
MRILRCDVVLTDMRPENGALNGNLLVNRVPPGKIACDSAACDA